MTRNISDKNISDRIISDKEYFGEIDGFNISTITATLTNAVSETVKVPFIISNIQNYCNKTSIFVF